MPRIVVLANLDGGSERQTFTEDVRASELESKHFVGQIVERLGWGLADAHVLENQHAAPDNPG
ncbi:MAG TPA: hypothetical protein VGW98_10895 [Solirubrobacteraceae bacterium]|jgi:hypothetical protein|nr:hypothetical protein [Solirubrobacteraceae bacterium]